MWTIKEKGSRFNKEGSLFFNSSIYSNFLKHTNCLYMDKIWFKKKNNYFKITLRIIQFFTIMLLFFFFFNPFIFRIRCIIFFYPFLFLFDLLYTEGMKRKILIFFSQTAFNKKTGEWKWKISRLDKLFFPYAPYGNRKNDTKTGVL